MRRVVLLSVLAACAPHVQEDESAQTPSEGDDPAVEFGQDLDARSTVGPIVATMVTRNYRLSVRGAGDQVAFSVMRVDGGTLAENIDLWQLARDYPELHRQYETAFAGEGIQLDARAEMVGRECESCDPLGAR